MGAAEPLTHPLAPEDTGSLGYHLLDYFPEEEFSMEHNELREFVRVPYQRRYCSKCRQGLLEHFPMGHGSHPLPVIGLSFYFPFENFIFPKKSPMYDDVI